MSRGRGGERVHRAEVSRGDPLCKSSLRFPPRVFKTTFSGSNFDFEILGGRVNFNFFYFVKTLQKVCALEVERIDYLFKAAFWFAPALTKTTFFAHFWAQKYF